MTPTPIGLGPTPDIYISSNGHINGYVRFDSENVHDTVSVGNENGFACMEGGFDILNDGHVRAIQGNGNVPTMNNGSVEDNLNSSQ